MTSYELLDFYEKVLNKIEYLEAYSGELSNLVNSIGGNRDNILNLVYINGANSGNADNLSIITKNRNVLIDSVGNFAMNFDILQNHQNLIRIGDELEAIFKESPVSLEEEKERVRNLIDQYTKVTSTIYEYVKTRSTTLIVKLLNEISLIVNQYNKFVESYKSIKEFILKTENKVEEKEDEKSIKLHFYDESINPEYFIENIQAVRDSYEIICQIFNIPLSENELKILKIESGSLLIKVIGDAAVIGAFGFLIKKTIELIFNKFTLEGKILRHKRILDLIKEDAEIIKKYKELGYDIGFNEDITKYHYKLIQSMGILVGQTTKLKIDDKEFSLEGHLKQKYLEESTILLIKESNSERILEEDLDKSIDKNEK